jgi:hypothetical protein
VLKQMFSEPLVRVTTRIMTDRKPSRQNRISQNIIGSPILQKDQQHRIHVTSASRVRRHEVALVDTAMVIADAIVACPSGNLAEACKLKQPRMLIAHLLIPVCV